MNPFQQGALGMAGAMLTPGGGLGQGFTAFGQSYGQGQQMQMMQARQGLLQRQMQMAEAEAAQKTAAEQDAMKRRQQLAQMMGMPTDQRPGDWKQQLTAMMLQSGMKAPEIEAFHNAPNMGQRAPIKLGSGDVLINPDTYQQVFRNEKPVDWNQLIVQGPDGEPTVNKMLLDAQIKKAAAGRTQVNVNTAEDGLAKAIGPAVAKSLSDGADSARGAVNSIETARRLNDALRGDINAGPGATFQQFVDQVASKMGVAGKDQSERMLRTREAIQSLAQFELDAAQQMKGQGQITELERSILRRAAAGDISGMTASELRTVGSAIERTARMRIGQHNARVAPLKSRPGLASTLPMLEVEEPAGIDWGAPAGTAGWGIREIK